MIGLQLLPDKRPYFTDFVSLDSSGGYEIGFLFWLIFNQSGWKSITGSALAYPKGDAVEILGFFPGGTGVSPGGSVRKRWVKVTGLFFGVFGAEVRSSVYIIEGRVWGMSFFQKR